MKILIIGENFIYDTEQIETELSAFKDDGIIPVVCESSIDSAMKHFFDETHIILLAISEKTEGLEDFIKELRSDEIFKLLPIFIILRDETYEKKIKYYSLGVDNFILDNGNIKDFVFACRSAVENKIKMDDIANQLRDVTEKNITKSIQLDLIKKFLPLTVWEQCVKLAENQDFEIPEEEKEVAIIFADLEAFTTTSEHLPPSGVVAMLNEVFDITTQIIYQNCGDIDKFIGDAFLAVFDCAGDALLSAVLIQDAMDSFNRQRLSNDKLPINFRMGVHYGKVIRGSVGGTLRFDNTLIGDTINTAQRLESMSSPGEVLVSKALIDRVSFIKDMNLDFTNYELKGKNTRIDAFEFFLYHKKNPDILARLFKENYERIKLD